MRGSVRNRLAALLLQAFEDPEKGDAILWVRLFCEVADRKREPEVPFADLLTEGKALFRDRPEGARAALASLIGWNRLFRLRRADTAEDAPAGLPERPMDAPWVLGLEPDARGCLTALGERARAYAEVLTSLQDFGVALTETDPLRWAVVQAAACFNAGLFFEAHEHLEGFWRGQPRGHTRRILQGIIQISVGFYHAQRGSYDGAANQLGKGLEKTAGLTGEVLGLDFTTFLPAVVRIREAILAGGREAMRPLPSDEIPRLRIAGGSGHATRVQ